MTHQTSSFASADWDAYARCYDTLTDLQPYQDLVAAVAAQLPTDAVSVLDAGCGTGTLLQAIARQHGAALTGIDGSPQMMARAMAKLAPYSVELIRGDLEGEAALPGSYDCIVSTNVLYTLRNPLAFLQQVRRVLNDDGTVVIATPMAGYDNGLILKAHCHDERDDAFWRHPHESIERENFLIKEAFGDSSLAIDMQLIATYNRWIYRTATFHFFTESELLTLFAQADLHVQHMTTAYADQCWLVVAHR